MALQLDILGGAGGGHKTSAGVPEGFRYKPELIGPTEEAAPMIIAGKHRHTSGSGCRV
jgi:hypothetical protein